MIFNQPALGDKAYCVLDSDFGKNKAEKIIKVCKRAKAKNIEVIISSPCFEIWYLCHFIYSTKQYSSNEEVIKELIKYIPEYTKSKEGIFEILLPKQEIAINNAKKLENYNLQNKKIKHTVEFMPSTEIYKIIEHIKTIKK